MAARVPVWLLATTAALSAGVSRRQSRWWMNAGHVSDNMAFLRAKRASVTGVYLYGGRFLYNGTFTCTLDPETEIKPYLELNLTVHVACSLQDDVASNGLASGPEGFARAAQWASDAGVTGLMIDYEPDSSNISLAQNYSEFARNLTVASHARGVQAAICISDWGILQYYDLYAKSGVDSMMSMAGTYYGKNISKNKFNVEQERQKGTSPSQLAIGVGTMMVPDCASRAKWNYSWTEEKFRDFVKWANDTGARTIDVWRADIDSPGGGPDCTEQYYFDAIAAFLKG